MTTIGTTCMAVMVALGLAGVVLGSVTQEKRSTRRRVLRAPQETPAVLPRTKAEPVVFRRAEEKIVTCRSAEADPVGTLMALGFAPDQAGEPRAQEYLRKELAYNLADQLIKAGGIRFYQEEDFISAELRALMPEAEG